MSQLSGVLAPPPLPLPKASELNRLRRSLSGSWMDLRSRGFRKLVVSLKDTATWWRRTT